jgi:hypothetical protein
MDTNSGLAAVHAAVSAVSRADHDAALASARTERDGAVEKARAEATEAGRKEGATAERARIKAIFGSEEARGRESFASIYAFDTEMSADASIAALKDKPKAEKSSRLDGRVPQPKVSADVETKPDSASQNWSRITDRTNRQRGFKN